MILSNLGMESTAFGFTAGFTGKALQEMLLEFGAKTDFIPLADGQTRINVKINAGQETEINGQGPKITREKSTGQQVKQFIREERESMFL